MPTNRSPEVAEPEVAEPNVDEPNVDEQQADEPRAAKHHGIEPLARKTELREVLVAATAAIAVTLGIAVFADAN